ncbi:MAG: hypothetical protein R2764_02235 [Bacteroidales bacterium]
MLELIITIYVTIGVVSLFSSFGKWFMNSFFLALLLMPFMVIYYLVFGPVERRKEAVMVCKGLTVLGVVFLLISGFIMLLK